MLPPAKDLVFNMHHMHYKYKESHVFIHFKYVLISSLFSVLIILDRISWHGFIFASILISWKLNGGYLIRVVLTKKNRKSGEHVPDEFVSPYIIGWYGILYFFGPGPYRFYLEASFCAFLAIGSLYDLFSNYPTIKAYDANKK